MGKAVWLNGEGRYDVIVRKSYNLDSILSEANIQLTVRLLFCNQIPACERISCVGLEYCAIGQ